MVNLLHDMAHLRGSSILMVTHDARVLDIADRVIRMEDGHPPSRVNAVSDVLFERRQEDRPFSPSPIACYQSE
ncbi:MAG: hypothetical protein U1D30_18610 [Planctomycetota bacterium]